MPADVYVGTDGSWRATAAHPRLAGEANPPAGRSGRTSATARVTVTRSTPNSAARGYPSSALAPKWASGEETGLLGLAVGT